MWSEKVFTFIYIYFLTLVWFAMFQVYSNVIQLHLYIFICVCVCVCVCTYMCAHVCIWGDGFHVALVVKNPPAKAGDIRDLGLIPGSGRSPRRGHGNPLQYSCLENPMDRGAWRATVHRVAKSIYMWVCVCICVCIFFFRFISIIGYYEILNTDPFAMWLICVVYLLYIYI